MRKRKWLMFFLTYFWIVTGMFVLAGSFFAFRENVLFWRDFFLWIWVAFFVVANVLWLVNFTKLIVTWKSIQKNDSKTTETEPIKQTQTHNNLKA